MYNLYSLWKSLSKQRHKIFCLGLTCNVVFHNFRKVFFFNPHFFYAKLPKIPGLASNPFEHLLNEEILHVCVESCPDNITNTLSGQEEAVLYCQYNTSTYESGTNKCPDLPLGKQ